MQIGFNLPISGPLSSPESMTRIAQQGEALGYDYLTLTDHVVLPNLRVPGTRIPRAANSSGRARNAATSNSLRRRSSPPRPPGSVSYWR
jgi:alkanesulfonate monooxygenase SsuD/methylene tetrahydromethanopterin reductase-like flavin-dependent oxidoreductase (luciferase family)